MRRFIAFTSIRSDYDLMSGLYSRIHGDPRMRLGLVVSGAHLSATYGRTIDLIEEDRLPILARIESLLEADSRASRIKSGAILLSECLRTIEAFRPDAAVISGDREDMICSALACAYLDVPIIHFFGGDHATDGNVDNPVRHAISKLSTFHFVSHADHRRRLLRIGERTERIFVVGNPALDKFVQEKQISKKTLMQRLRRPNWSRYAVMIHHPILGSEREFSREYEDILATLKAEGIDCVVISPNTDPGNKSSQSVVARYAADEDFCFFKNLDRETFVNLLRHAELMIGNSSAGLLEAPSIPLPAINVGRRQVGRANAGNVIFVESDRRKIAHAIRKALSAVFRRRLDSLRPPFGSGKSVKKAHQLLQALDFQRYRRKTEDPLLS